MSFDRGAPAFWFVEIFLDGETLRHCNAGEAITFDGQTYLPLGDKLTPPRDIDRAANLKAQKFTLRYDSSLQTVDTDIVGKILDSNWKRRPIRVRYAIGDVGASGYDFSDPFIIADEAGRIKDLEDTIEAGDAPLIEMEVESGALVFLERRNQTRTPANQRAAFPDDAFFDLAKRLDGVVLPWRTKRARNGSAQITYEIDEPAPRQMLIGRGITRGSFVFGCTVGPHRGWWIQVFALADHECEALEQCFINGVDVLAGQAPLEHGVKRNLNFGGEPRLSLTWYDGRHDQTANAELITLTAAQPLKWTSAHRGRGVSYCIVEHRWDSDLPESYSHEFVLKGAKVYREQFDTTAGGSGAQRLNDPDSWTWTANPEEALRHYLRGRVVSPSSSYKWFGVDAPSSFIDPYAAYKYRADHCDESVALKLGGTQPRYEANGWISAADSHARNIQRLADCMVADPVDEGGRVSIRLSEPQSPVVELLDTDLISDEETVAGINARAEDVINRVEGRYRDPANKYSQTDYPAVASEAFQEIDGAEIEGTFNQDLETSEERAQRKATLYLNKMRRTLELEEHFGPKAKDVRPGDWLTRKSALRGFPSGKTFIADEVRRFTDGTVRLLLLEVDPGELAWNEADAQLTDIGDGPEVYDPPSILIPSVAVLAVAVTGGGATYPGVRFTVTDYDDFVGDEIECEFGIWNGVSGGGMGIAGPSAILKIPGSLETFDAAANFLPGTTYAFRFRERAGERQGAWSSFQTETMTGDYIVGASAIADSIVGQGPGATAAAADVLNAFTATGVNQLIDHAFRFPATFWRATAQSGTVSAATNETLGIRRRTLTGAGVTVGNFIQLDSFPDRQRFACRAGDVIEASAFVSAANVSNVQVFLTFYNASDAQIGFSALPNFTPGSAFASLNDFVRAHVIAAAPTNTAYAFLNVRAIASTSAPVLHVARPMLARANASQTAPTAWNPGFDATPGADPTALNNAAGILGQGPGATAPAGDVLNSHVPIGVNQLIDHEFRFNASFWRALASAGSVAAATNETAGIRRRTLTGTGVTVGQTIQLDSFPDRQRFACRAGDVIEASAFAAQSNCSAVRVQIAFHNAADAVVASSALGSFTPGGSFATLADFTRIFVIGTAPAGTAYARIIFSGVASTTAPVMHIARPMLAQANANQSAASAWNPGFNGTPGADPTAANTAAAIASQGSGATANNLAGLNATDNANLTQSLSTSRRLIVSDFSADGRHWTTAFGGTPETVADPAVGGYFDVANLGRVLRFNAFPRYLTPKGTITPTPGRRYAVIARVRMEEAPAGGAITFQITSINGLNTAWGHGDPVPVLDTIPNIATTATPAVGVWTLVGRVFSLAASPNSFNAFWRPRLDVTATGTGGRAEVANFIILDVTDVPLGRILTGLLRADGVTAVTEALVVTGLGTAAAVAGQGPGATAAAADVLNDALRTSSLFNVRLPDRPAVAADFTASLGSGTPASIAALSTGSIVNVANEGDVRQFADNTALTHRGWLPIVASQTYRIRVRAQVTVNGTGNQLFAQFVSYNAAGTVLAAHVNTVLETDFVIADGWIEREVTVTGATILAAQPTAAFIRARVFGGRNSGGAHSGATWRAAWLRLEDATDAIRFATVQTGADVTALSQLTIAATTQSVIINCDSAGVPAAGQLPRTVGLTLKLGNTVVSADAAWSIVSAGAATASVDDSATAAAGNLTVTALPANADIIVSATYGGVTLRITVSFNRLLAPPPVSGSGGGTSASDTSIIDPAGTSFAVVSDTLTVTTGSGGQVRLVANVDYNHFGTVGQNLIGRWQRNISGTWTDVGTEVTGTNSYREFDSESGSNFDYPGTLSIDQTITGLGASTSQSFRLRTRRSGGTSWSVYGSATATGS